MQKARKLGPNQAWLFRARSGWAGLENTWIVNNPKQVGFFKFPSTFVVWPVFKLIRFLENCLIHIQIFIHWNKLCCIDLNDCVDMFEIPKFWSTRTFSRTHKFSSFWNHSARLKFGLARNGSSPTRLNLTRSVKRSSRPDRVSGSELFSHP